MAVPSRESIINDTKVVFVRQFLNNMTEENYNRLNSFCEKYETNCFIQNTSRFVMFPNKYTFEDHDFDDSRRIFRR